MSVSPPLIGGARDRLLPPSIPFRFFAAAVVFHALAWLVLLLGARELPGFSGGAGLILAALHLLTLGVLAMTAIGASYQLLPVVTHNSLAHTGAAKASFWFLVTGIPVLAAGMAWSLPLALDTGGGLVSVGLLVFAALTADSLRRAGSLPVVAAHGWAALVALIALIAAGLYLIANFETGFLSDPQALARIHMVLAVFGFMGLLVVGFSQILVPMFALAGPPRARPGWVHLGLAVTAILVFLAGAALHNQPALVAAAGLGLGAATTYLWLMRKTLRKGMRKRLGLPFLLIKTAWALLVLGLLVGLGVLLGAPIPNGAVLFGFLILVGWLLTFLLGILQRIMPFLASMHVRSRAGRPPLLSELTPKRPLALHAACHLLALALISAGILLDLPQAVQAGAALGLIGAVSFAVFAGLVMRNMAPDT